jgi:hypothetical protein
LSLKDLDDYLDIIYEGSGHKIAKEFYLPVLSKSTRYDRASGYFSVDSLVVIATGLSKIIQNNRKVRLVLCLHDLGQDLKDVYYLSRDKAEE